MKKRVQYTESKVPRPKSWLSDADYYREVVLAEETISGLQYLRDKKSKEMEYYRKHMDIRNNSEHLKEYFSLDKKKNMLEQEIAIRTMEDLGRPKEEYYDSDSGIVYGENGEEKYAIAYTEDEDDLVYVQLNTMASSECRVDDNETDYDLYEPKDRNESYKKWNYTKDLSNE